MSDPMKKLVIGDGEFEIVDEIARNKIEPEGGYFHALNIGLTTTNASANVTTLNNFMTQNPNAKIVVNNGKVFPFNSTITLTNNVQLMGSGQFKYVGEETTDYFVTTYVNGSTYYDVVPQNTCFEINIDCNGLAQGVCFSGGIHNRIIANIRNAKGNGYYLPSGSGYENVHSISVMNDDAADYADSVGVYCEKADEVFNEIFTRNCNTGLYMRGSGLINLIHSWCYGDNVYPNSKTVSIYGSHVTIHYLHSDTMEYPLYFERLVQGIKVDTIFCSFNSSAVTQSVATNNSFRPWKTEVQPTAGQKFSVEIGELKLPTINGTYQNNLNLEAFDGFVEIFNVSDLQVIGDFKYIPLCTCYAGGDKLTNTPSGYNNNYKTIKAYRNNQYKFIELKNDYPSTDPIVYVSISLTTWISKWMTVAKTQLAEVNPE